MKKKNFVLLITALFIIVAIGILFLQNQKKPPLETKFVQRAEEQSKDSGVENNGKLQSDIQIKDPGTYTLVSNPKHTYQTFNNCGPATLSMILSFYGRDVSQKELGEQMRPYQISSGDNDDKTIFTYEFVEWAKKYGSEAIGRVNGDIELLKKFTANGIPVVVKTWLHINEDIGHFRIVRGFDEEKQYIIQDDSYEGPNRKISYYDFLSMWQPFNYAYVIVYTGEQKELVETILGEELDEGKVWNNALIRAQKESELDATNAYPVFNMSTSYYHLGNYQKSVESFEKVEKRLPKRMLWYQIEPIQAYYKLENYERVNQIIDKVLTNGNRAYSELYQIRGEMFLLQGKNEAAKSEFEKALYYNNNYSPASEALKKL